MQEHGTGARQGRTGCRQGGDGRRGEDDPMPLDVVRVTFGWLQTGPSPLALDGHRFPGLPQRMVSLREVRDRLLARSCPQPVRDAVWAELVVRSRERGGAWTVGCAGVALPALTRIAATLTARFAGDPRDVHAAVLTGFLAELPVVELTRPRIMLRLRWAAYRAGHACVREALDAPTPAGHMFTSTAPPQPHGHPDFVLARAVAEGILSRDDAELIGSTRLGDVSLDAASAARGTSYQATKKARLRAEQRLVAYLHDEALDHEPDPSGAGDPADRPLDSSPSVNSAGAEPGDRSLGGRRRGTVRRVVRRRMSPMGTASGVQGYGNTSVPVEPTPTEPAPAGTSTAEVQRCA